MIYINSPTKKSYPLDTTNDSDNNKFMLNIYVNIHMFKCTSVCVGMWTNINIYIVVVVLVVVGAITAAAAPSSLLSVVVGRDYVREKK